MYVCLFGWNLWQRPRLVTVPFTMVTNPPTCFFLPASPEEEDQTRDFRACLILLLRFLFLLWFHLCVDIFKHFTVTALNIFLSALNCIWESHFRSWLNCVFKCLTYPYFFVKISWTNTELQGRCARLRETVEDLPKLSLLMLSLAQFRPFTVFTTSNWS